MSAKLSYLCSLIRLYMFAFLTMFENSYQERTAFANYIVIAVLDSRSVCEPQPSPLAYIKHEHICGRPLGLRFNKKTGDLYIADAYFGLMKVGPEGGIATSLATEAEGVPLTFTNDLDVDDDGNVYFTDSSSQYRRRHFMQLVFSGEDGGRVLKYDPVKKETTVLLKNIQFPNGITLSKDGSFFIFCEGSIGRTNKDGDFWVALHCRRSWANYLLASRPKLRDFLLRLPIKAKYQFMVFIGGWPHGVIAKYSSEGELLQILEDSPGKVVKAVSEVEEREGKLWIGSVLMPFVAVYDLGSSRS
ncbi:Protein STRICTOSIDINE SYNTHASE-LIKE 3 [Bienertia sinuspersici]